MLSVSKGGHSKVEAHLEKALKPDFVVVVVQPHLGCEGITEMVER